MDCPAHCSAFGSDANPDPAFQALTFSQIAKLDSLLKAPVEIHSRTNFPELKVSPVQLVKRLRAVLLQEGVLVHDLRLNGSAASHCIADEKANQIQYNDLDLIFHVLIRGESDFRCIKECVLKTLMDFLPESASRDRLTLCSLEEAYVYKQVKVNSCQPNGDRWSLISLHNEEMKNMELKFVDTMNRQYQFSTDSFQIILDSYFQLEGLDCIRNGTVELKSTFFPSVQAYSAYGNFAEAEYHLNNTMVKTKTPEEIRGGGLFKYCNLLNKGHTPCSCEEVESQEITMCTRFFIDFADAKRQSTELQKYFVSHYLRAHATEGVRFLDYLLQVVRKSSIYVRDCTTRNFENMITNLKVLHLYRYGYITLVPAAGSYRSHARKNSGGGGFIASPTSAQSGGNSNFSFNYSVAARVPTPPGSYVMPMSPYVLTPATMGGSSENC